MPSPAPYRRVVVTGMGALTPMGLSLKESWDGILAGKSGIRLIQKFSTEGYDVRIAGEIFPFPSDFFVPKKEQKKWICSSNMLWLVQRWLWINPSCP